MFLVLWGKEVEGEKQKKKGEKMLFNDEEIHETIELFNSNGDSKTITVLKKKGFDSDGRKRRLTSTGIFLNEAKKLLIDAGYSRQRK